MEKGTAPQQPPNPPPYSENQGIPGVHQTYGAAAPPPYQQQPPNYQTNFAVPPTGFVPSYGATQTHIIITPPIVAVGACPACRVGLLEDDFTCLGLLCAILFFPIGILCCLALKNRRCSNCGAYFA